MAYVAATNLFETVSKPLHMYSAAAVALAAVLKNIMTIVYSVQTPSLLSSMCILFMQEVSIFRLWSPYKSQIFLKRRKRLVSLE